MINDGTVKWEIIKITEAEISRNSKLLEGQTAAQIIANTLSQVPKGISVSVTAGTIRHGRTIPVPGGYTRAQCKYAVWLTSHSSYGDTNACGVDQNTGVVTAIKYPHDSDSSDTELTAGYLCIAVK